MNVSYLDYHIIFNYNGIIWDISVLYNYCCHLVEKMAFLNENISKSNYQ